MKNLISFFLAGVLALASCGKEDSGPIQVGSVELSETALTLTIGEEQTLTATVTPDNAVDKAVTWRSSDPKVAAVSDAGSVEALTPGTTTITATAGGKSADCTVTVEPVHVGSVTLDKTELTFRRGMSETLAATVAPDDATFKSVTWESSDTKVATVSEAGLVAAVEPGKATITATADGRSATCAVIVKPDVYVTGYSSKINNKGLLWKNGECIELPFNKVYSVFVHKGEVYVTGVEDPEWGPRKTYIWRDGTVTEIDYFEPSSIYVTDDDIYVGGSTTSTGYLWTKSGGLKPIESEDIKCEVTSVCIDGEDVYATGRKLQGTPEYAAVYWKNGEAVNLTNGSTSTYAVSISAKNGVVCVGGYEGSPGQRAKGIIWTSKTSFFTTYMEELETVKSVCVSEKGDYYVGGWAPNAADTPIWKNDERIQLSPTIGKANLIFLYGDDIYAAGYWNLGKATVWANGEEITVLHNPYTMNSIFVY